jgi:hypothetical protein
MPPPHDLFSHLFVRTHRPDRARLGQISSDHRSQQPQPTQWSGAVGGRSSAVVSNEGRRNGGGGVTGGFHSDSVRLPTHSGGSNVASGRGREGGVGGVAMSSTSAYDRNATVYAGGGGVGGGVSGNVGGGGGNGGFGVAGRGGAAGGGHAHGGGGASMSDRLMTHSVDSGGHGVGAGWGGAGRGGNEIGYMQEVGGGMYSWSQQETEVSYPSCRSTPSSSSLSHTRLLARSLVSVMPFHIHVRVWRMWTHAHILPARIH